MPDEPSPDAPLCLGGCGIVLSGFQIERGTCFSCNMFKKTAHLSRPVTDKREVPRPIQRQNSLRAEYSAKAAKVENAANNPQGDSALSARLRSMDQGRPDPPEKPQLDFTAKIDEAYSRDALLKKGKGG